MMSLSKNLKKIKTNNNDDLHTQFIYHYLLFFLVIIIFIIQAFSLNINLNNNILFIYVL